MDKILIGEAKAQVSRDHFDKTVFIARETGFETVALPIIPRERMLF